MFDVLKKSFNVPFPTNRFLLWSFWFKTWYLIIGISDNISTTKKYHYHSVWIEFSNFSRGSSLNCPELFNLCLLFFYSDLIFRRQMALKREPSHANLRRERDQKLQKLNSNQNVNNDESTGSKKDKIFFIWILRKCQDCDLEQNGKS